MPQWPGHGATQAVSYILLRLDAWNRKVCFVLLDLIPLATNQMLLSTTFYEVL